MRPCKKFGHFINWFDIYLAEPKTNVRRNRKENRKGGRNPYLSPQAKAQPAQPTGRVVVYLPAEPSSSVEAEHAPGTTSTPSSFQASPCRHLVPWRTASKPRITSP